MADYSQDSTLLRLFRNGMDVHSNTGAQIAGMTYEDFMAAKAAGNQAVVGEHGYRYCGKFVNLSNQYRVGVKKARIVARVQYGLDKDYLTIKNWQDTYHRAYPGVKRYWQQAIRLARELGYAETRAGRRFYLSDWNSNQWGTESSAINFPIQGTGADMKELAIAVMARRHPEFEFTFDLHDGLFFILNESDYDQILVARETLDKLPYKEAWGWEPSVPMTWDASAGKDWGSMEEL